MAEVAEHRFEKQQPKNIGFYVSDNDAALVEQSGDAVSPDVASNNVGLQSMETSPVQETVADNALCPTISSTAYSAFTGRRKRFIILMTSWAGFFAPVSTNIYYPALNTLARELQVSNAQINLTLTSFMVSNDLLVAIFWILVGLTEIFPDLSSPFSLCDQRLGRKCWKTASIPRSVCSFFNLF
jgi:hypothetical protein